jgi:exodeoxyribonuclease-5
MQLSPQQDAALVAIEKWLRDPYGAQSFVLAGFAGSGKSTLLRRVVEDHGGTCCTPTGKAAAVLASKLPEGVEVKTLHSFLYTPDPPDPERVKQLENALDAARKREVRDELEERRRAEDVKDIGEALAREQRRLDKNEVNFHPKFDDGGENLVIVDECSMVSPKVERDLRNRSSWTGAPIRILFVGDPAQLPPVDPQAERRGEVLDFFERNQPNAMLTEVHRQASDSAILRLATVIRSGDFDPSAWRGWDETCRRVDRAHFRNVDDYLAHDQVITGMNATRRKLNLKMRERLGHTSIFPDAGERVICLRNDHKLGIVNGVQGSAMKAAIEDRHKKNLLRLDVFYDGARVLPRLPVSPHAFLQYQNPALKREWGDGSTDWDFGYAITCHKAQGSEWGSVLVADDAMRENDVEMRRRWIYTAVTRAREKLTWVI